ncbi:MAG: cyclic di-GMP-binding protein FimX [Wenzhouxiangellaceae bacterium]
MYESAIPMKILAVDDDPSTVREIEGMLEDDQLTFHFADTSNAINRVLGTETIDLALLHLHSGSSALLEPLVRELHERPEPVDLIVLIDPDAETALAAATAGVDGIAQVIDPRGLVRVITQRLKLLRRIAHQREQLRQVSDIHERYNLLLESSSEAIAYLHQGLHIYANPSYLSLFGYSSFEELEGFSILDLLNSEDDGAVDLKQLLKSLTKGQLPEGEIPLDGVRADGSRFRVTAEFAPAHYEGEPCIQILVRERVEGVDSALLEEELEKLRSHDMLTGLLNRQAFIRQLTAEIEHPPHDGYMAVLLCALDKHGELQGKVGAAATDVLIQQAAQIFTEVVDEQLLPTRLSDHIFACRLWFQDRSEAEALATRIVEAFSGRILEIHDKSPQVTASVGMALNGAQTFSADELLSQAENALREAERTGGNSYVRYRPASAEGDDGEHWDEKLRHALNNKEFRLVSVPITSMEDESFLVHEFETRLRMEGSDEIIMPSVFRPAAQKAGLSAALDRDLVQSVVDWLAQHEDFEADCLLPLSADSIGDDEFVAWLQTLIDEGKLHGPRLIIGVRESEIRERLRELQRFIARFAVRGVRSALLDVSLDTRLDLLLKTVEVDFVKLAGDIIPALRGDEQARSRLEALVGAASGHELQFIAPKVDNAAELAVLWQFGITLVQDDFVREED